MKLALLCAAALVGVLVLSGCGAIPMGPGVCAPLVVDEKGPLSAGDMNVGATKVGTADAEGILFVGYGDGSISAAARNGNITKVHHVDSEILSIFGIYARYRTVVYGE
jgi:hypothetical protein